MSEPTHTPIDVGQPVRREWLCMSAGYSDDVTTITLTKRGLHRAILGDEYAIAGLTDVEALVDRMAAKKKEATP